MTRTHYLLPTISMVMMTLGTAMADDFLQDDFSMDPEVMGYRIQAPPPSVSSDIAMRLEGNLDTPVDQISTRINSILRHPLTEQAWLDVDMQVNLQWPTDEDELAARNISASSRVDRATLTFERPYGQLGLGVQSLRWGYVPGSEVLDVVSPQALTIDETIEGHKVSQISAQLEGRWRGQAISGFVTPRPALSIGNGTEHMNSAHPVLDSDLQELLDDAPPEFGLRLKLQPERLAIDGYLAHLLPDMPVLVDGAPTLDAFWMTGASATYPIGPISVNADLAYKSRLYPSDPATVQNPRPEAFGDPRGRLDTAVGLDYQTELYGEWSTFINLKYWPEDAGLSDQQRLNSTMALSWSQDNLTDRLALTLTGYSSLTEEVLIAVGRTDYRLTDNWSVTARVTTFLASDDTAFADQNRDTDYLLETRYEF